MKVFLAGGESRHWLQAPLIKDKDDENIFSRRVLPEHGKRSQTDCMGGIVPEVTNENISCRSFNGRKLEKTGSNILSEWGGYG